MALFLVYFEPAAMKGAAGRALGSEAFRLQPGLHLVETDMTQSMLYHAIKRELSTDTPLLVATLADVPKFKKLAVGALKWVRAHSS